jgi:DNA-binding NarL/FixJ family response regulator
MMGAVTADEQLRSAQELVSEGRWEAARQLLAAVLLDGETAEALDAMGTSLWWLGLVRESLAHRERAYAAYRAQRRYAEAVIVALDVSVTYLSNLDDPAVARGWVARARRAADLAGGDERLQGWVWLLEGYTAEDPRVQHELTARALELARRLNDVDLELGALADLGLCKVVQGEVRGGLDLLDEAMAGTLAGECERLDTVVWASCSMLAACTLVGDQRRAAQWCSAAERFAERYGCPFLQARCRSHYGRVLVESGDWPMAEVELNRALAMSADCGREPRVEALAGLAQLRLRQGAVAEAERMLAAAGDGPDVVLVAAELMIARGRPERAIADLSAALGSTPSHGLDYPVVTAALVDAHLAGADVESAGEAAAALEQLADHQHPQAAALTARACGRVAAARGDTGRAVRLLHAAVAEYDDLGLPFQAGRTRLELADALAATAPDQAAVEAGRALERMERLGAMREVAAAAALLRTLGVATRPGPRRVGSLSRRERDVLALVADGLTNPQIGTELYISPRTVAHHVSSILGKLGLRTRAEAAAFAARHLGEGRDVDAGPGAGVQRTRPRVE